MPKNPELNTTFQQQFRRNRPTPEVPQQKPDTADELPVNTLDEETELGFEARNEGESPHVAHVKPKMAQTAVEGMTRKGPEKKSDGDTPDHPIAKNKEYFDEAVETNLTVELGRFKEVAIVEHPTIGTLQKGTQIFLANQERPFYLHSIHVTREEPLPEGEDEVSVDLEDLELTLLRSEENGERTTYHLSGAELSNFVEKTIN